MIDIPKVKEKFSEKTSLAGSLRMSGRVAKVVGLALESVGPKASIGEVCALKDRAGNVTNISEIVGFKDNRIISMALGDLDRITPGMEIVATGKPLSVKLGDKLLGRVLDGLARPMDDKPSPKTSEERSIYAPPPNPLQRKRITEVVSTGIKSIDAMLTLGKGQRVGVFAGSGVGKSTLIGMIARNTSADVNVIALIGERGREVKEFIEKDLGERGLARSVVIVATSDAPPLVRVKAALTATTIGEYFRDRGLDVMFMMDSATRLSMAQREVGLTVGEPPTAKGYTPSVFSLMQKTMERAGASSEGTITGLYTVLVEGDDFNEPISDAARGILDGHIILSRKLASLGHYPAIDVLESKSRVMNDIIDEEHRAAALAVIENLAVYRENEDLITVGAYQKGSSPKVDKAVEKYDRINDFLKQRVNESVSFEEALEKIKKLA